MEIKKQWLIIIIFSVLAAGVLYWYYLNSHQFIKTTPTINIEATTKIEKPTNEAGKSIKLEKPPFIKD